MLKERVINAWRQVPERLWKALPERGGKHVAAVAALLLIYLALLLSSLWNTSVTTDEFGHLPPAYAYLKSGDTRWLLMEPPLQTGLAALGLVFDPEVRWDVSLPREDVEFWWAGFAFMQKNRDRYHGLYMRARLMVAVLAAATGLLVYGLARGLAGGRAGLLALLLLAFSPDFLAHGGLVTSDLSAAFAVLAAALGIFYYRRRRSPGRLLLAGLGVASLFLAKFSALLFLPLIPVWLWLSPREIGESADAGGPRPSPARIGLELAAFGLISFLVLAGAYRFQHLFLSLGQYPFKSAGLAELGRLAPWLPVPAPAAYVRALDLQLFDASRPWVLYLFGQVSMDRDPLYYPVCFLFKTPLPLLLLLGLSLVSLIRRRTALWTLVPAAWYFLALLLMPGKQYGSRILLPPLGFILVLMAVSCARPRPRRKGGQRTWPAGPILLLLVWYTLDTVLSYPHFLAYFNELAGGPRFPHRGGEILLDSNLDWGQDWKRLARWQEEQGWPELRLAPYGLVDPAIYGVRYTRDDCRMGPGYLAVSANLVGGVDSFRAQTCYTVLRQRQPVARPGPSILVYRIP
jgi:hypothetical protein